MYYLGNLLYGRSRHEEALTAWQGALDNGETYYVLFRNLGMAYYNVKRNGRQAMELLSRALELNPDDPQLIFEMNYLMQLLNRSFADRLELLERFESIIPKHILQDGRLSLDWKTKNGQFGPNIASIALTRVM